jgi:hypothetical protein
MGFSPATAGYHRQLSYIYTYLSIFDSNKSLNSARCTVHYAEQKHCQKCNSILSFHTGQGEGVEHRVLDARRHLHVYNLYSNVTLPLTFRSLSRAGCVHCISLLLIPSSLPFTQL